MKNNKSKLRMLIDFDDVLCPCVPLAIHQWNEEHPKEQPMREEEITAWGKTGTRTDQLLDYYTSYQSDCYMKQRPSKGAPEFVRELQEMVDVYICTAVPPDVTEYRMKQIKRFFPTVSKSNIIIASRKDLIAADSFQFMLDDSPEHIIHSKAEHTIMWRRPWNERITGVLSAEYYDDVVNIVKMVVRDRIGLTSVPKVPFLYVLVGTSGSGKNDVIRQVLEKCEKAGTEKAEYVKVRSFTTKAPFEGEKAEYFTHVTTEEFLSLIANDRMSEYTKYAGNYFGTDTEFIRKCWEKGQNCIMAADISGAMMLKRTLDGGEHSGAKVVTVYCERERFATVKDILQRNMPEDEKALRLSYLDAERQNQSICDISVDCNDPAKAAAELMLLGRGELNLYDK